MPGGRPTVMTSDIIAKLEQAFALGCTDLEACFYADISKDSLYDYQNKNPEFTERKEKLKERPIFLARQSVVNDLETNSDLALKFLERKKKDEFSTKTETDLNANVKLSNQLTDDELEKIAKGKK